MCRGYLQRKQTAKMRAEELVFLGMVPPPKSKSQKNMPVHVAKKVEVRNIKWMPQPIAFDKIKIPGKKEACSRATRKGLLAGGNCSLLNMTM